MTKLVLLSLFAFVAGAAIVGNALWGPRARARRRLARGVTRLVDRDIVTLLGRVRLVGEPLVAPLSGRGCVAYEAVARVYTEHGHLLVETIVERSMTPFELVTADGPVVVDGTTVELALPARPLIPRKLEREQAFLEAHAYPGLDAATSGFEEVAVRDGDRIAVQGMAVVELAVDSADRGYRDAPTRVRLVAHADHPLTIGAPHTRALQ